MTETMKHPDLLAWQLGSHVYLLKGLFLYMVVLYIGIMMHYYY